MIKKYSDRFLNGLAKALREHCSTSRSGFQNYFVGQSTNQQAINVRSGFQNYFVGQSMNQQAINVRSGFQNYFVGQSTNQQAINVRSGFQKKPISPIVKALLETF